MKLDSGESENFLNYLEIARVLLEIIFQYTCTALNFYRGINSVYYSFELGQRQQKEKEEAQVNSLLNSIIPSST